jgi:hypothetical protein
MGVSPTHPCIAQHDASAIRMLIDLPGFAAIGIAAMRIPSEFRLCGEVKHGG